MSLSRAFSLILALAVCASLQPAAAVTEADIAFCIVDGFYWNRFEIQYFFFDTTYGRWSNQDKQLQSSYPKPISTGWPGIPTRFDAVLDYENRVYFFKDGQYWRWNLGGVDQVDPPYPRPISPTWWPGVPDNLDAAFKWQNKYYFIADSQYHVFDKNQNKVVESGDIQTKWPGLPSDIDTAFVYNDLWLYFFKGLKYWRYDLSGPAAGYPKNICTGWGICDHVLCAVKVAPVAPAFAASTASASAAEFVTASEVETDASTATAANDSNLRGFTASANTAEAAPGPDTSGDTGSGSEGSSGGDGTLVSASNVDQGDSP